MHYLTEESLLIFLVQVFIILGLSRALGELFRNWRQPAITAEILVGILLGPTVFGRLAPSVHHIIFPPDIQQQVMLDTVAWFGILLFLLKTGLETEFSVAWRQRGDAFRIALSDIIVPIVIAFIPSLFLPEHYLADPGRRISFALFIATIMTISALPVTIRVLNDLEMYKTELGFLIMSALSVNDIIGWVIFTLILGAFTQTNIEIARIVFVLIATIGFTTLSLTAGRHFTNYVISRIVRRGLPEPGTSITFITLLGALCGTLTLLIGIHALFGFFIAGIMAGEARALSERTRNVISQMVTSVFVPLFFASIGLRVDFLGNFDVFLALFILIIGVFGRYLGAWIGVLFSRQSRGDRNLISIAHVPGGEMQIVVSILALELGLLTETVFVAIVFGAIGSTIIIGPWMARALEKRKEISLLEFFTERSLISELKAADRDTALRELSAFAAERENMPEEALIFQAVTARESELGTGIGQGVAIPHARLDGLRRPAVFFGRSPEGIDWNAPDGNPVHLIFFILTPREDSGVQLQILRFIAMEMRQSQTREALLYAPNSKTLWKHLHETFAPKRIQKG
jgi:Kef-type K+ transport system membrane component KefB/mannitol/fructose-specific phosphotransferase system IIA component (Ntr-type)